jgi:gamma-tubulin complex component 2
LWYHLSPNIPIFEHLNTLISLIKKRENYLIHGKNEIGIVSHDFNRCAPVGGALLNILADRIITFGGNPELRVLYELLLDKSSVPYLHMTKEWITKGYLSDNHGEFMIQENLVNKDRLKDDFNDIYWEQRYTIQNQHVPNYFEHLKDKILLTGKYLNVLRECSIDMSLGCITNLSDLNQQKEIESKSIKGER